MAPTAKMESSRTRISPYFPPTKRRARNSVVQFNQWTLALMRTKTMHFTGWDAFSATSCKREEDPLSVMSRGYLDWKSKTQSGEKSSSGVGEHIFIGQYADCR
jgi:hypothetical protein